MHRSIFLFILYSHFLCFATAQSLQQYRDSLDVLNQNIKADPANLDLRLKKAAVNIELGQWEYAIEEYGRVLLKSPDNFAALYFRAYAHTAIRQYGLAKQDYEHFLQLSPRHFEARLGLAVVLEKMGRKTDAFDELNRLVQMHPDSALAWASRAAYEMEQEQLDVAVYDWQEAMRLNPHNVSYAISCVSVLLKQKNKSEARRLLDELIKKGVATRAELRDWLEQCQ